MGLYESKLTELKEQLDNQGSKYDSDLIIKAYNRCYESHGDQKRLSGEPYFMHPFCVARIVITLGMDSQSVAAALLHDVVEDTEVTYEDVKKEFGTEIAELVDGVTKLGKIPFESREKEQAENIRKMFIAMSHDIRVIIIKLADRLHNLRTIEAMPEQKRRDKSLETLEVYAPIAHRLGIRAVKEELEDLAIKYLDPVACREIEELLDVRKSYRNKFLEEIKERVKNKVDEFIPNIYIEGRVKSIHGIYRKMYMQGRAFEEIYDIYAVRIITDTVNDCYNILGLMHEMFRPLPNRFKDYISTPKPNMYQSLHTTVIGREGIPFEIQIRTWEMHHTAEYGIAAHWKYKEGIEKKEVVMEERLSWIRQILESQNETDDAEGIVQTIKVDLSQEDVFVMTPKGDVINLPVGSTVIDFAFAIHSAVGTKMVGAKVDGRIVPITHEVKTGEIIEIITTGQVGHGPSRDWLSIAKTNQAKTKIRSWFKKEKRPENIAAGKNELEKEFSHNNIRLPQENLEKLIQDIATKLRFANIDDFYAAIGYGGVILSKIMPRIKEEYSKYQKQSKQIDINDFLHKETSSKSSEGVVVNGIDNCLIKLSKCCAPLPGDEIIGFITRGHGVSIHKRDCNNVPKDIEQAQEPERWVAAKWTVSSSERFNSSLHISAINRRDLLADITVALANLRVSIHAINARELKDGNCVINVTVGVENLEHLKNVIARLNKVESVINIERTNQ